MTTRFAELELRQLIIHPKNIRRDVGNVVDLANSITAQGIMQHLVVAPTGQEKYIIIAGHRRHAACQLAGLDVVPCVIRDDLDSEPKQLEAMLVENTQRTDLTIMEEARGFQTLFQFPGYTAKTVAKSVGRSQKFVKDRAKLATLDPAAIAKLEAKQMTLDDAMVFAEFADDESATQALLDAHGTYDWRFRCEMVRRQRDLERSTASIKAAVEKLGAKIIDRPENLYSDSTEWIPARRFEQFDGFTSEDHIAAGHYAIADIQATRERSDVLWVIPADQAPEEPEPLKPGLTPEQIADQERRDAINAGLKIAEHVRHEHLRSRVVEPTPELLDHVREVKRNQLVKGLCATELETYLNLPRDSKPAAVRESLEKFTATQLDVLQLLVGRWHQDQELRSFSGWGPSRYGSDWAKGWRELVTGIFGYELSDIEREAIKYVQEQRAGDPDESEDEEADEDA